MEQQKIVLLRVGVDKGKFGGGQHSPLLNGGDTYAFLPIPESAVPKRKSDSYTDIHPWGDVREYMESPALQQAPVHNDPEFRTFTYGDLPSRAKAGLFKLKAGDVVAFYAGFDAWGRNGWTGRPQLCLFSYMLLEQDALRASDAKASELKLFRNNAHMKRVSFRQESLRLVLLKGDPNRSRVFRRAIPLTNTAPQRGHQYISRVMSHRLGIDGSLTRSVPRQVPAAKTEAVLKWLEKCY